MVDLSRLGKLQQEVYEFIPESGGILKTDIAAKMNRTAHSLSSTIVSLRRMGLVKRQSSIKVMGPDGIPKWAVLWTRGFCPIMGQVAYRNLKAEPKPKKKTQTARSGVIAPKPYHRGSVWGAGII